MKFQRLVDAAVNPEYGVIINYDLEHIVITPYKNFSGLTNTCIMNIIGILHWEFKDHDIIFGDVIEYDPEELWGFHIYKYGLYAELVELGQMADGPRRKVRAKRSYFSRQIGINNLN